MVIRKEWNSRSRTSVKAEKSHVLSICKNIEDYVEKNFRRTIFPAATLYAKKDGFIQSLLDYLMELHEEIMVAPISSDSQEVGPGDLVAVRWQETYNGVGVVYSTGRGNYNVFLFPSSSNATTAIPPQGVTKIQQVNSPRGLSLGNRVSFKSVDIYPSGKVSKISEYYQCPFRNYEFFYGGRIVVGYRRHEKPNYLNNIKSEFIFCKPEKMTILDEYQPVEIPPGMMSAVFRESGMAPVLRKLIESHNILRKVSNGTLNAEEIERIGVFYEELKT